MKTTIFNTPIVSAILHHVAKFILLVIGWHIEGQMPDLPKFVWIGAPHTSNWDFMLFLAMGFFLRANLKFMGKAELFRPPFGFFFYWCGGIPVERSKSTGLVEQTAKAMRRSKEFILAVAPQGTRDKTREWKSGFYHIAKNAGVPIVAGFVDGKRKVVGVGRPFTLTDDAEADIQKIKSLYAGIEGIADRR